MGMAAMKPIPGLEGVRATDEFLVFEVQSFTDPAKTYRVDLSMWWGSGACSCEQFQCRIQPRLGSGDWTEPTTCKHLQAVYRYLACQVSRRAIEQRQQANKRYDASEPDL